MSIFLHLSVPSIWKIVEDEAEALVVAPLWTIQSWWPQLAHLIVDFYRKLPPTRKILYQLRENSPTTETKAGSLWGHSAYQGSFAMQRNSGKVF